MKKSQFRRIKRQLREYQQRLVMLDDETDDAFRRIDILFEQVHEMKQALARPDPQLESWRDLLTDMQVEIAMLKRPVDHPITAGGNDPLQPTPVPKQQPPNGFSWWRHAFARPAPAPVNSFEQQARDDLRRFMVENEKLHELHQILNPRR
jgi:hypothetical protein